MICELQKYFGEVASSLPNEDDQEFILSRSNLPKPPEQLRTDELTATWGWHFYEMPIARADFFARKATLRALGVLIMARLFRSTSYPTEIVLGKSTSSSRTPLRSLVLDYCYDPESISGYARKPDRFCYIPEKTQRCPWAHISLPYRDYPRLVLGNPESPTSTFDDFSNANVATGFGHDYGNALIGELLLNLGSALNGESEVVLESAEGHGGVGPGSAEIRFFMPGHVFYDEPEAW